MRKERLGCYHITLGECVHDGERGHKGLFCRVERLEWLDGICLERLGRYLVV
jgi:hypothetical protein